MLTKNLINIPEEEKSELWNKFEHENTLLSELEYYQDKVKSMKKISTVLDIAVITIYRHHIKNLEKLLDRLHSKKPVRSS